MVQVPWPITSAPGDDPQEGAGRLINVFAERRGDDQGITWRRAPGAVVFAREPSVGTAAGTAVVQGVSEVLEAAGAVAGVATVTAAGSQIIIREGIGDATGNATATAVGSTA